MKSFRAKLSVMVAIFALVFIAAGIASVHFIGIGMLRNFIGESQREMAGLIAKDVSDTVDAEINSESAKNQAGRSNPSIGSVTFDKRKDAWVLPLSGTVIGQDGALKDRYAASIDIARFFKPLECFKTGKTGIAVIVDDKGYLAFHPLAKPFKYKFSSYEELRRAIQNKNRWSLMDTVYLSKGKTLAAFSEVDNAMLLSAGIKWRVFVIQNDGEALAPIYSLLVRLALAGLTLALLLIAGAYILGGYFIRSITQARNTMRKVALGDINPKMNIPSGDEFGDLTDSLNEMTDAIKREWQMTTDAMPEAVFVIDRNNVILKANANFIKMFHLKEGDIVGRKYSDVLPKLKKPWPSCSADKANIGKQAEEIYDPAIGIPILVTIAPILDTKGERKGAIYIIKDLSSEKKTAAEIEERKGKIQKVEGIKNDLLITVADLQKPLSVIEQELKRISREKGARLIEREQKVIEESTLEIDRLIRCISRLTDIGKLEIKTDSLKEEMMDFKDLIRKRLFDYEPKIRGKGLELKTDIPKGDLHVYGDKEKIGIVISILIENSIKFTSKGRVDIAVKDLKESVEFSITDTGIGIAREDIGKVFGRLQQFSHIEDPLKKATGLSLSLCKEIVEAHGGSIWLESEPGIGSKFIFTLPKRKEPGLQ